MPDPLTLVGNEAWTQLEASSGFTDIVLLKNRIKFDTRAPTKAEISSADVPEVRIIPTSDSIAAPISSNSLQIDELFEIQVATGSQSLLAVLWPLKWEIYRVLVTWQTSLSPPKELTWDTTPGFEKHALLTRLQLQSSADGILNRALNRGITGWASLIAFQARLVLPIVDVNL